MQEKYKESFIAGAIGAFMGIVMSFLINYFLIPLPTTQLMNGINHAISGLISGFMGGFMGVLMYFIMKKKKSEKGQSN